MKEKWITALTERKSGRHVLIPPGARIDADDEEYDEDAHIIPVKDAKSYLLLGVHEFSRNCYCGPEVRNQVYGKTLVIHTERVN